MNERRGGRHVHKWQEELRIFHESETRVCFFCPDCKGRKEETIPSKTG